MGQVLQVTSQVERDAAVVAFHIQNWHVQVVGIAVHRSSDKQWRVELRQGRHEAGKIAGSDVGVTQRQVERLAFGIEQHMLQRVVVDHLIVRLEQCAWQFNLNVGNYSLLACNGKTCRKILDFQTATLVQ